MSGYRLTTGQAVFDVLGLSLVVGAVYLHKHGDHKAIAIILGLVGAYLIVTSLSTTLGMGALGLNPDVVIP